VGFAVLPGTVEQAALVYPALGQRLRVIERTDGGYRRPVLEITHLNSCRIPTQFLEEAVDHILTLTAELGDVPAGLRARLLEDGRAVLESNASGYRRPLFKQLATTALAHV
jgi:hypothetical protein